jgi:putative protease
MGALPDPSARAIASGAAPCAVDGARPRPSAAPEVLAPAGDRDALSAALAAGADAVYFGLDDGFNARARATNFASTSLGEVVAWIHRAGVRAYIALNTLVFESELSIVEELIRRVAAAGADAIIVQDPAVALLARAICPDLEVHASTQMTVSSPLAAELLGALGIARVVVPRELSVDEIRTYAAGTALPLEVFIHGALCVSWSGQCLSSEAWGGRSANRGQCAQACRLPYQLIVDGGERDLGDVAYLLSPKDLVGLDAVPELAEIGIAALKIEGRLKGPHYVATAVAQYRAATAAASGQPAPQPAARIPTDEPSLHVAYSRGLTRGFLAGSDHQTLVEGRFPHHRGVPLGRVIRVAGDSVLVAPDPAQRVSTGGLAMQSAGHGPALPDTRGRETTQPRDPASSEGEVGTSPPGAGPRDATPGGVNGPALPVHSGRERPLSIDPRTRVVPRAGMGVVFDRSRPHDPEEGGPIFAVIDGPDGTWLRFGRPGPTLAHVHVGDRVWITSDPRVSRAGEKAAEAGRAPLGRIAVDMILRGALGTPLELRATARGRTACATSASVLQPATGTGLSRQVVVDKLGALGGTPFHLGAIDCDGLAPALHLPVGELKELRRSVIAELTCAITRVERTIAPGSRLAAVRTPDAPVALRSPSAGGGAQVLPGPIDPEAIIVPLCRTDAQLDAVLDAGAAEVELDWMELVGLSRAVLRARRRGARVGIATMRIQKPGEECIDQHLADLAPDHVLVRSWGALATLLGRPTPPALHGDFSLNVTNSITAGWVLGHGLTTLTAAHDLDRDQLFALLAQAPRGRIAVAIHHHVPTFHTEHCVYAHLLSTGRDYTTCGRPCERHQVALRDRVGLVHPVVVDVGCRNTVFNAQAQSAASLVPELLSRGVRRFRVELVRESAAETARVFTAYLQLAAGQLAPREVIRRTAVHEQFGVTRGTMRTLTVLR